MKQVIRISGQEVTIRTAETPEDTDEFREFVRANLRCLAVDTETTGLDIYSDTFQCRLVQFGTPTEAWVIPVELGAVFEGAAIDAINSLQRIIVHNASYDLQVIEQTLGIPMEKLWPKTHDTRIFSHLLDPRGKKEGGTGHSLEELTVEYIDPEVAENVKGLMARLAREYVPRTTKAHIWKLIDLFHPEYQLYAGVDAVLAARLYSILLGEHAKRSTPKSLIDFEHRLAEVCAYIERQGFLLDVDYSQQLSDRLLRDKEVWEDIAFTEYGLENVNSIRDCAEALEVETGVRIKERTASGDRKVDKALLERLISEGNPLAEIISETKRLGKWEKTWVRNFLEGRDSKDRCHAHINTLQARTARMSITGIPAQTLPAGDWMIRRCFVADPGHLIASVDYQTQELRVLAALSGDSVMIQAFQNGMDLHQITADAAGVERKVGKMANFLQVYGGGAGTLATNANIPFPTAKNVLEAFSATYPGVTKYSRELQAQARSDGYVTTPIGRRLPVDDDRVYSALNYMVQSTSRDVTAKALLRLHDAGFTPYVRLPIHDEVLVSIPADKSAWGAAQIGEIMTEKMGPVTIGTDPEVGKRSWGSLYGSDI